MGKESYKERKRFGILRELEGERRKGKRLGKELGGENVEGSGEE